MIKVILGIDAAIGMLGQNRARDKGIQTTGKQQESGLPGVGGCLIVKGPAEAGIIGIGVGKRVRPLKTLR